MSAIAFEPRTVATASQVILAMAVPVYIFVVRPYVARQTLRIRVGEIRVDLILDRAFRAPRAQISFLTSLLERLEGEPRSVAQVLLDLTAFDEFGTTVVDARRYAIQDACRKYERGIWPLSTSFRARSSSARIEMRPAPTPSEGAGLRDVVAPIVDHWSLERNRTIDIPRQSRTTSQNGISSADGEAQLNGTVHTNGSQVFGRVDTTYEIDPAPSVTSAATPRRHVSSGASRKRTDLPEAGDDPFPKRRHQ